jgi:hypothetical protein
MVDFLKIKRKKFVNYPGTSSKSKGKWYLRFFFESKQLGMVFLLNEVFKRKRK